jgi:RNA polymerase sigma-70 factor (ECF subfamily)
MNMNANTADTTHSALLIETISRSRDGDAGAFARIVHEHQSYAYALAVRLLCNEHEAEDVVQESFVRVWINLPRYDVGVAFTTWLYTIVTNLCLDRMRSRKRIRRFFSSATISDYDIHGLSGPDSFESLSNRDLVEIVHILTGRLTLTQRLVFTLRDLQQLSIHETAAVTGLSPASVKTHLSAARRRLRDLLQRQYALEDLS